MIAVKGHSLTSVFVGDEPVKEIRKGVKLLWRAGKFLNVSPQFIFLMKSNNHSSDVNVTSNTEWEVDNI